MLCLSPYQRVFYALASWCPSQRTRDSSKTLRPYSLCPKVSNTNDKLLSPNHLRSLPAAPHSDLSACQYKGVIPGYDVRTSAWQHVFRGCFRSYSATTSLRHLLDVTRDEGDWSFTLLINAQWRSVLFKRIY